MDFSDEVIAHIKRKAKNIHHGEISIVINETSGKVDVVVQERERFRSSIKSGDRQVRHDCG